MAALRVGLVALAGLSLGACVAPVRDAPPAPPGTPAIVGAAAVPAGETVPPAASVPVAKPDAWERLRNGLRFARCEPPPAATAREMRRYLAYPAALSAALERSLPELLWVLDAIERAGLPTEYALLPMVESAYRAGAPGRRGPGGYWQFVPVTARDYGLPIRADYDARLDLAASTDAAVRLLQDLSLRFGQDWALVTMAYNAGEYRVRRALRDAGPGPADPSTLRLRPVTHTHSARLEALACIVRVPGRAGVSLPPPTTGARLASIALDAALDLDLAAALAGMAPERMRALNPGLLAQAAPAGIRLLVPEPLSDAMRQRVALVPPERRVGWHAMPIAGGQQLPEPADADVAALVANANPDPRAAGVVVVPAPADAAGQPPGATAGHYVVRSGDSLWLIARRFDLSVDVLRRWNRLAMGAILHPGQVLRIVAP